MKEKVLKTASEITAEITRLSDDLYNNPELGNCEYKSADSHVALLKKYGFSVERPYLGYPTGYRAEYRSGKAGPRICYMAEYDALPDIGHGCGHNMLGACSIAAGIILRKLADEIGGTVIVLGTPAEETNGAKVVYAKKGAFLDVDAAMLAHPSAKYYFKSGSTLAMDTVEFEFTGLAAHAAGEPERGINALDAVIATFNNINAMRQQMLPDARVHGIITEGGVTPNIIPDHCVCRFYVRAANDLYLPFLMDKVKNCAKGAAVATGCKLSISRFEYGYKNLVTNEALSDAFCESLEELGVTDIKDPGEPAGSADAGDVSHVCPTIHAYFPITEKNIGTHTKEFAEETQTRYAKQNMMITACGLAMAGAKIIKEPERMAQIKKEFKVFKSKRL